MKFSYWIQKHDYTSEEIDDITLTETLQAFEGFDWAAELDAFDEGDESKNCPPGIGIDHDFKDARPEGMLLHICPKDGATAFFHFHRRTRRRFLGLWPTFVTDELHSAENISQRQIPALIKQFFAGGVEAILSRCG